MNASLKMHRPSAADLPGRGDRDGGSASVFLECQSKLLALNGSTGRGWFFLFFNGCSSAHDSGHLYLSQGLV